MPGSLPIELRISGLSCRRGGRWLFRGLAFTATQGTLVQVTGVNGSGKTSLLRLLCGLGLPESGEVRWNGVPVQSQRAAFGACIAWVGHSDGLKAELTPRENLRFHQALVARPDPGVVDSALSAIGLEQAVDAPCRHLSAGQRRRAALARLLLLEQPLWILDEPLAALDLDAQDIVQRMVDAHCVNGGIAVLTSHQAFDAPGARRLEVAL